MLRNVQYPKSYLNVPTDDKWGWKNEVIKGLDSQGESSRWLIERKNGNVMLKSKKNGVFYLHVRQAEDNPGGEVRQWPSQTEGSQWKVECAIDVPKECNSQSRRLKKK